MNGVLFLLILIYDDINSEDEEHEKTLMSHRI